MAGTIWGSAKAELADFRRFEDTKKMNWRRGPLAILYVLGAGLVMTLAWLPVERTIGHFLYEDFFYYLKVAENITQGKGVTLDGVARTNGFHPMWMAIIVLIRSIAGHLTTVHVALTVAAAFHLGQVYLLHRILAMVCSQRWIPHLAALFWMFNYRVIACNMCGLETSVATLCVFLVIHYLFHTARPMPLRQTAVLGALLGFAALSRFDLLLLLGFVMLWVVADPDAGGAYLPRRLLAGLTLAVVALSVLLPWFIFSVWHSNALLPNSSAALKLWAFPQFALDMGIAANLRLLRARVFGAATWLTDTANLLGFWPVVTPKTRIIRNIPALMVLCSMVAVCLYIMRQRGKGRLFWAMLLSYGVGHVAYYCLFARAEVRYLMPSAGVFFVAVAAAADKLVQRGSSRRAAVLVTCVYLACVANAQLAGISAWQKGHGATRTHSGHLGMYRTARWIRENLPDEAVIGAWDAGIYSYYSGRTVVNLDGVINDDALDAIRHKQLCAYIAERNIGYLVGGIETIEFFMDKFGGRADWRSEYTEIGGPSSGVILERRYASSMPAGS